jgi:CheY-like chemotaxis protein
MNGEISVDSEPDKGSTFVIRIPQIVVNTEPLGTETAKNISNFKNAVYHNQIQTEWENMAHGKVLIVDDLDANIYVARGLLAPYELQVDSARSGFEAIEKVKKGALYDIILMDHMMPKMDGVVTVRRLREMGYIAPVVVFTANAIVGKEDEFLADGFNDFLSKPIQSKQLDVILNKFINVKNTESVKNFTIDTELFQEFKKSTKTIITDLNNALKKNDYNEAVLLMHTLKSLAGLVGETTLMNLSNQAEAAFRKKTHSADIADTIKTELEKTTARINVKLNNSPSVVLPPVPSKKEIKKIFTTAEKLLKNNDAEIINMIPSLASIPGTENLINEIEAYNFTLALDELKKFK